jgi:putative tributyrin esterase
MWLMLRTAILCLALVLPALPQGVAARNISTIRMESPSLGQERSVNVLLPTDYETSTRRYPVLYLLHGLGDNHTMWSMRSNVSEYAAHQPIIIVMPDGSKSWYVNSAADSKARFEDFIVKDLVAYVDSHYRTLPHRRSRAVAGLSMGGYGALLLGLKHPDVYSAIGAFSGAIGIAHEPPIVNPGAGAEHLRHRQDVAPLFGPPGSPQRREYDPFAVLDKVVPADMPMLYLACGGQDFLLGDNRAFVDQLSARKIPYEYREVAPRIHSWDFWDDQIRIFLGLLRHQPGFRP